MATMLELMQQCTRELGIPTPTVVASNTNLDVVQLLALMNACGYELMRRADWQGLTQQHTFYTEALTTTGTWTDPFDRLSGTRQRHPECHLCDLCGFQFASHAELQADRCGD
jgi:hypothetical protein